MTSEAPDPNSNNIALYLVPVCILSAIALCLCVLRIWTRLRRTGRLYVDDWIIIVAETLSIASLGCAAGAAYYGWGRLYMTIQPDDLKKNLQLQFAMQTIWIVTLCLVRLSVAFSLLKFGHEMLWKGTLYGIMALQVLISSSYIVIQFAQCTPVSSSWENVPDVKCWPMKPIIDYGWAIAAIYVTMDLILALMPLRLIRSLTRPISEKILIGCLMAAGLTATAMACGKMTTFNEFGKGDPMQATVEPSTWAKLEEVVGIIASCLPSLKAPTEKVLRRLGVISVRFHNTRPSFVNSSSITLHEARDNADRSSSAEGASSLGKDKVRIDSVFVGPGKKGDSKQDLRKDGWEPV
ncbi:hypothetical protein CC78DRAFT_115911 [Lojkania enalia]|uniref:Rhodopsin domain-containing protein n=1 Tax=Lojkania enalia TaxID=147567 RepID=A0A9P4N154_9PLEO|nr:hypothetical protein CC78DRAFT_115911 [Didymosphaeria enalia]